MTLARELSFPRASVFLGLKRVQAPVSNVIMANETTPRMEWDPKDKIGLTVNQCSVSPHDKGHR